MPTVVLRLYLVYIAYVEYAVIPVKFLTSSHQCTCVY